MDATWRDEGLELGKGELKHHAVLIQSAYVTGLSLIIRKHIRDAELHMESILVHLSTSSIDRKRPSPNW